MESRSFPFNCYEGWSHMPNKKEQRYAMAGRGVKYKTTAQLYCTVVKHISNFLIF